MGNFDNVANLLIKYRRIKNLSQDKLGIKLGYNNGQTISNVERGLAGLPLASIREACIILDIDREEFIKATVDDFEQRVRLKLGLFNGNSDRSSGDNQGSDRTIPVG